ncbi:MAG: efflux RND transporter periplasmic adaptor subunit [Candidatus Competibacteraceae bacterium]|nr:efflux RND transporter periplasmic adaptor subunit [Candidatus Competibacteraceae bacterium]
MKLSRSLWLLALSALALLGTSAYSLDGEDDSPAPSYRLGEVERGPVVNTVTASGTLNAVVTVEVGSQVSGQIAELAADFNSQVQEGEIIARIDPANFQALVREAEAEVEVARSFVATEQASVAAARSDLRSAQATLAAARAQVETAGIRLANTERDRERAQDLQRRSLVSEREEDAIQTAFESARAQLARVEAQLQAQQATVEARQALLAVAEARVEHARARVRQQEAVLERRRIDLERTIIRAPMDGIVIERNVDIGQTVAASLQAPTLFTIARDLRRMQVEASIDEADIGLVASGQPALFRVDAFPLERFGGQVVQIRKAPQVVQNVVTYDVIISADNPELRLLPGMTATVEVMVQQQPDTLRVPNAALRFTPPGGPASPPPTPEGSPPPGHRSATLWLPEGDGLQAVELWAGISDDRFTEISGGKLQPGDPVVVGYQLPED